METYESSSTGDTLQSCIALCDSLIEGEGM